VTTLTISLQPPANSLVLPEFVNFLKVFPISMGIVLGQYAGLAGTKPDHDTPAPARGHMGACRTLELMQRKFIWRGMLEDNRGFVRSCDNCQRSKPDAPKGFLHSLQISDMPWSSPSFDFITCITCITCLTCITCMPHPHKSRPRVHCTMHFWGCLPA
jgi:Integrase zinc binding domain